MHIFQMLPYYFLILISSALAVSTMASEVVFWIGKTEYFAMTPYIPYFVFAYVLYGIGNIYGRGLDLAKKTQYYWIMKYDNFCPSVYLSNTITTGPNSNRRIPS